MTSYRARKLGLIALGACVLVAALPGTGSAGRSKRVTSTTTASCTTSALEQPFARFGDYRSYALAPGGAFEGLTGDGWTLANGAKVMSGNEPWQLRSASDSHSLSLPPGAVATSPAMCVTLDFPIFRMPVRSLDPYGQTDLVIEVRYPSGADTSWKGVRTESGKLEDGWRVTSDIDLKPDTYGSTNEWRQVHLRFTAKGTPGDPGWRVDDVYVDPRMR